MNFPLWAQQPKTLEEERQALLERKQKNDQLEEDTKKTLDAAEATVKKNTSDLAVLEDIEKNRKAHTENVINEIDAKIGSFSTAQRLVSRRATFYRCIRGNLQESGVAQIPRCKSWYPVKLNADEEAQLNAWNTKVGLNTNEVKIKKEQLTWENKSKTATIENVKKQVAHFPEMRRRQHDEFNLLKAKEVDIQLVKKNEKYLNCDANTPDVSLEEKVPYPGASFSGPFVGVPRDHQDGLGTCYANAAKNLLVGASQGKDVASYLDVALAYKGSNGVVDSGLDAGESCSALNSLEKKGFCPQKNAPLEIGERNSLSSGGLLRGATGSVYDQAVVVKLLQRFLAGRQILEKGNKELSEQLLNQSKAIVHNIKLRPNLKIPLPIVRHQIPGSWKIAELHSSLKGKYPTLLFDQFNREYQNEYRKFYPAYVRAVVEGKSRDDIFEIFKNKMSSFISKYQIESNMKQWKTIFMQNTEADAKSPTLKKDLADSVDLLKIMSGKAGKSDEEFLKFCDETQGDSLQFLNTLQPLIKHLNEIKVSTDELYGPDGKFRNPEEMMQLVVAPSCIHSSNRKKFSSPISCRNGYNVVSEIKASKGTYPEKVKQLRRKVLASLLQGYPLGNTFARHINTIVGMRFNKELNRCEYKIRESQNATSTWQSEAQIFDVISALTEVRRK